MRRKPVLIALAATVLFLAAPAGGVVAASPTVRLAIAHVVSHCHVWKTSTKLLGPSTRITVVALWRLSTTTLAGTAMGVALTRTPSRGGRAG